MWSPVFASIGRSSSFRFRTRPDAPAAGRRGPALLTIEFGWLDHRLGVYPSGFAKECAETAITRAAQIKAALLTAAASA
jgi:hypothetical protein